MIQFHFTTGRDPFSIRCMFNSVSARLFHQGRGQLAPRKQRPLNARKTSRIFACALMLLVTFARATEAAENAKRPPNIVVIMGDDWSYPHAGAYQDPVAKTPTFDRIAAEGVVFENAFVTAPSCTPSRFAFATGQHHWRLKEGNSLGGSLAADVPVYPDLLAAAGYRTGFCRKGASPSKHKYRGNDPFGTRFKNFNQFMQKQSTEQPFCFWYGAGEPHRPYDFNASIRGNLPLEKIQVPACLPDNQTTRADLGDYYLRVEKLDQLAGQIVDRLEKDGQLENTIVIMAGDNGMPFPRCKATLYDGGTRVPLAIRWGKQLPHQRLTEFVSLIDLAPTILAAAGVEIPTQMTGKSLLSRLKNPSSATGRVQKNHVLLGREKHVYQRPARAIRTADFLYVRNFSPASWPTGAPADQKQQPQYDFASQPWPTKPPAFSFDIDPSPTKQWMLANLKPVDKQYQLAFDTPADDELYDLKKDPQQLTNVAGKESYQAVRNQLSAQLSERLRETGDPRFRLPAHSTFQVKGWTVHLHDRLWQADRKKTHIMLGLLAEQFDRIVASVPAAAVKRMRQVPIWINPQYEGEQPRAEYHPGAGWLRRNGRDPAMVKCVEVSNVSNFAFECKRMPYLMLHELAHAYHDQVLDFNNAKIEAVFAVARDSGTYDRVKRFNGRKIVMDRAYALSNAREYFAESTEAYFGKNDFFPFDRKELKEHDPRMHDLLEQLWAVEN